MHEWSIMTRFVFERSTQVDAQGLPPDAFPVRKDGKGDHGQRSCAASLRVRIVNQTGLDPTLRSKC